MFIVNLTYKVPLEMVEQHLENHITWLNEQYQLGHFHASGKKIPRTGGIILSKMTNRIEIEQVLAKDPFRIHDLVTMEVIEFTPSKTSKDLESLK